jgi:Tetratricopeptide repeat
LGWTRSDGCRSAALALLLAVTACAPVVRVQRPQPATVDLGPRARVLALVRVNGPGNSPTVLVHTMKGRAHRQGVFQILAWSPGEAADTSGRTAYLALDVVEWSYAEEHHPHETQPRARVRVDVRAARTPEGPWSEPYQSGGSVEGIEGDSDPSPPKAEQLLVEACLRAVDDLLRAVAPRPRIEEVELDVDDDLLRPGAAFAERGELEEARSAFESVRARHPDSAAAAYDLGVVVEALGDWERAEVLYLEAASRKDDRLYRAALNSVRARLRREAAGYAP